MREYDYLRTHESENWRIWHQTSYSTPTMRGWTWRSCGRTAWGTWSGAWWSEARRWRRQARRRSGWLTWSGDASNTWCTSTRRARTNARASPSRASSCKQKRHSQASADFLHLQNLVNHYIRKRKHCYTFSGRILRYLLNNDIRILSIRIIIAYLKK